MRTVVNDSKLNDDNLVGRNAHHIKVKICFSEI